MKKLSFYISVVVVTQTVLCLCPGIVYTQTIATGYDHSIVICNSGLVESWGKNEFGQLGNGTVNSSDTPAYVIGLSGVKAVSLGQLRY